MNQIKFSLSCLAWLNAFIFAHRTLLDDVLLSIETVPINSRPSSCRQMSRPIHYISDALHGLVYISNLWSPFNGMVETRNLRPQKRFCLTNFCQKKCYVFFFSFLFFSFFLSFFFFSFLFNRKWAMRKAIFSFRVLVPFFFPASRPFFLQYFSMATKKKKKKNGLSAYIPPSGKCESTYLCTRVCDTNLYLFIYLFIYLFFFSRP